LNGWIAGGNYQIEGGIVGRTRDGGRTWRFVSGVVPGEGAGFSLGTIQFRDTLSGLATASGGRILVTYRRRAELACGLRVARRDAVRCPLPGSMEWVGGRAFDTAPHPRMGARPGGR
jgi:hypothetical protein